MLTAPTNVSYGFMLLFFSTTNSPCFFLADEYICLVPISVQFCKFHEGICVKVKVSLVWDSTLWTSVNEWIRDSWIIYYLEYLKLFMNILVLFLWETQIYTSGFKFVLFACLIFSFQFFYFFLLPDCAYPLSKRHMNCCIQNKNMWTHKSI